MPWPADRAELVGVNSFGIGGSNAHVRLVTRPVDLFLSDSRHRFFWDPRNPSGLVESNINPETITQVP